MTVYNGATYTWNAENRLVSVEKADKKITFLYDYMGRRVRKQVYSGTTGSWNAVPDETRVFVYDGWNLIKEIATNGDTYYVWGLDLSQSMQGAGGIGGLVCSVAGTAVRHYTYDANGNVGQLVDEAGAIVARYEYDPFGNEIRAEGDDAQTNPFRFSTKYLDAETGLYYYGFRYYSAEIGRWVSRDPLEEFGGFNLYAFVSSNSVNRIDPFGLFAGAIAGAAGSELGVGAAGSYSQSSEIAKSNEQIAKALWGLINPKPALDAASEFLYGGGAGASLYDFVNDDSDENSDNIPIPIPIADSTTEECCIDDAERECPCSQIKTVRIYVIPRRGHPNTPLGHASVYVPTYGAVGWTIAEIPRPITAVVLGMISNDNMLIGSPNAVIAKEYRSCPESISAVISSIHLNSKGNYHLANVKARNCAGWVNQVVLDAGFRPLAPPNTPRLSPESLIGL